VRQYDVTKHRHPALPYASPLRVILVALSLAALVVAIVLPSSLGTVLVGSAAAAGLFAVFVGLRSRGIDRTAWVLMGLGQFLNALGNLTVAIDPSRSFAGPGWADSLLFSTATLATVIGLVAFLMPVKQSRLIGVIAFDLVLVMGCVFTLGWTWDVPHLLGSSEQMASALGLIGFLAVVLDSIGVGLTWWLWRSRPPGEQAAVRLALIALVVAALGDTGVFTGRLHMNPTVASLAWVTSSLVLLVATTFAPMRSTQLVALGGRRFLDLAAGSVAVTVVAMIATGGPKDGVVQVSLGIVLLLLLIRQLQSARANQELAEQLAISEQHYRNLIDGTQEVIVVVRDDGTITYASPAASRLFGMDSLELAGIEASLFLSAADQERTRDALETIGPGGSNRLEIELRRTDGTSRQVEVLGSRTTDGYVLSMRDVTERAEILRRVEHAARRDTLTGLPNRLRFEEALDRRLASTPDASVIFCDLDGFKRVNDTCGHSAGDYLLAQVAQRLEASLPDALVARFGGDEFAILLRSGISKDAALALTRHAQAAVAGTYRVASKEITLHMAAGLAFAQTCSPADVLRNADLALYDAKAAGRGQVRLFEQSLYEDAMRRLELDERLRRALESEELSLRYQPIVDLETGIVVGAEALVRWVNEDGEILPAQELVDLAESSGSVTVLGEWVLTCAVTQAAQWRDLGYPIPVAVNVSPEQLLVGDLAHTIQRLLRSAGLSPDLLTLEITETVLLQDAETAIATMERLRELGIKIALDDFGTGYSSFAYLSRLPIDQLKIDRFFVAGIGEAGARAAIVRTMSRMSHDLGLTITAEGVENATQLELLVRMGVHRMQGYLVSRPISPDDFIEFVRRGSIATVTLIDARLPGAGSLAARNEGGGRHTARPDAAPPDASPMDAAPMDSSPMDLVPKDSSPIDASPIDSVPPDASPMDPVPMHSVPLGSVPIQAVPIQLTG
jgi:diguanylate cyclase (GGDEF)-like protein/PAS domain S-box-containing protein